MTWHRCAIMKWYVNDFSRKSWYDVTFKPGFSIVGCLQKSSFQHVYKEFCEAGLTSPVLHWLPAPDSFHIHSRSTAPDVSNVRIKHG